MLRGLTERLKLNLSDTADTSCSSQMDQRGSLDEASYYIISASNSNVTVDFLDHIVPNYC